MQDFTTKAELAREHGLDQRDPRLQKLEAAGQVKLRGGQPVKLYNREEAKKILAKALEDAAEKYSQDNFEAQWAERRKRFDKCGNS
jgi:hypothetical protein